MGKRFYSILQTSQALRVLLNQLALGLLQEYAGVWFLCLNHWGADVLFLLSMHDLQFGFIGDASHQNQRENKTKKAIWICFFPSLNAAPLFRGSLPYFILVLPSVSYLLL